MRIPALLLLLLLVASLQAADESGTPDAPLSESELEAAMAAEIAAAEAAAEAAGTTSAASEPLIGNENFVPSIQISEDLSVSFPVDI